MIPRRFHPLANALALLALALPMILATAVVAQTRSQAAHALATVNREAAADRKVSAALLAAHDEQIAHLTRQRDDARAEVAAVNADNAALVARLKRKPRVRREAKAHAEVNAYSGSIPTLIRGIARQHGLGAADTAALVELARRESTFRPTATNGSCKGLFQLKTSSSRWSDPAWNTAAAIGYIERRYGSPRGAIAHHDAHHWY